MSLTDLSPSRSTRLQAARPRIHLAPQTLLAGILAGAVGVLILWWQGANPPHGLGAWLTEAGRVTGLLAGYGAIVLIGLMARIPALEHTVGSDRLARWHASGGRYTVSLVVAHGLLIWWGYAVSTHTSLAAQGWALLATYPDVLMATVGGLLFVAVGVISARAARARLRYETWYYLHFYTYLATALAFTHQFATGADFIHNPGARVAWSALYAVVGAALIWYRVITPIRQVRRHRMRVAGVRAEAPGVVSVYVAGHHLAELDAQPGQFFRWRFLTRELWWSSNPYSLSAPPTDGMLRLTVRAVGDHSQALASLRPGTRIIATGPFGAFTTDRRVSPGRRALLIAGGLGIAPVRSLLEALPTGATLVYRAHSWEDIVFQDELDRLATARDTQLHYVVGGRAELGGDPLSARDLAANVPRVREYEAYVCGPPGMSNSVVQALRACGVPRRRIHHESFEL